MKLTEAELQKTLGKKEPLPGGDKQVSPQVTAKPPPKEPPPGIDPQISVDPKRVMRGREEKAQLAKGGKVKPNPFDSQKAPPFGKKFPSFIKGPKK